MFIRWLHLSRIARASSAWRRSFRGVSGSRPLPPCLEPLEARTLLNAGDLDPTFGSGGKVLTDFIGPISASAKATVIQPDGKIIVAGNGGSTRPDLLLARYNPDGTLDTSFGTGGRVNTEFMTASAGPAVADVALQQDGKIVVVGGAGEPAIPKSVTFVVARYNPDGSPDASFGTGGQVTTEFGSNMSWATGVAVQSDGRIIVAGNTEFTRPSTSYGVALARYMSDGQLDSTFGTAGKVALPQSFASNIVLQPDGHFVVAGGGILRFNPDGSLDSAFGDQSNNSFEGFGYLQVAVQPDSKLVAIRLQTNEHGGEYFSLQRFTASGVTDTSFGTGGYVGINGSIGQKLLVQADGKIDVVDGLTVARFNADGSPDLTFGNAGTATATSMNGSGPDSALAIQIDGKIVAVTSMSGAFALARFNPDGSFDASFGTGGQVTTGGFVGTVGSDANLVALQPDGKILVAGFFASDLALVRYNPDGSLDSTFGTGGRVTDASMTAAYYSGPSALALQADGKILVLDGSRLKRYNADGTADAAFTPNLASISPSHLAVQSDGKILLWGAQIGRLNPDGSLDTSFGNGGAFSPNVPITDIAVQPDGKLVTVGPQQSFNANTFTVLARFNPDGTLDTGFGTGGEVTVRGGSTQPPFAVAATQVFVEPDAKILIVGNVLERFNPDGSPDIYFGDGGQITIYPFDFSNVVIIRAALGPDGSIAVSAWNELGDSQLPPSIYLFHPNGSRVVRFGSNGQIPMDVGQLNAIVFQPDAKIVVVGTAPDSTGLQTFLTARYQTVGSALTDNELYVAKLYLDLLQRPVDAAGLAGWTAVLDKGGSRAQVVQGIQNSHEYRDVEVQTLYQTVLGRAADPQGAIDWGNFLAQGGTTEQLEAILIGSDEYFSKFGGGTNSGFLQAAYQLILHRSIDSSGSQSWAQALAGGMTRMAVAEAILASLESDRRETQTLYGLLLHRPPDPSGLATFTDLLQQGMPNETTIGIIAASDEYFAGV